MIRRKSNKLRKSSDVVGLREILKTVLEETHYTFEKAYNTTLKVKNLTYSYKWKDAFAYFDLMDVSTGKVILFVEIDYIPSKGGLEVVIVEEDSRKKETYIINLKNVLQDDEVQDYKNELKYF